jgi:hypothetical protein
MSQTRTGLTRRIMRIGFALSMGLMLLSFLCMLFIKSGPGFNQILIPTYAVSVFLGVFTAIGWGRMPGIRQARMCAGCCPDCAYNLQHDMDAGCPECGWNRDAELQP